MHQDAGGPRGHKPLHELVEAQTTHYLHSRALVHLEAAIGSLLDINDPQTVAAILRGNADDLERFG